MAILGGIFSSELERRAAPGTGSPRRPWFEVRTRRAVCILDDTFRVKVGLAEMLKGGVIMDVTNAEQALIAEKAGATAVMALERVPADIRKEGGVARMAPISKIREIMQTVSIPVMAKARIGHFMEARILEALGVDYIDESEVLTPADEEHHIDKRDLQSAVRVRRAQSGRGAAAHRRRRGHDPHQGRSGLGQHRRGGAAHAHHPEGDEAAHGAGQGRAGARVEEAAGAARTGGMGGASTASCRCRTSRRAESPRRPTPRW